MDEWELSSAEKDALVEYKRAQGVLDDILTNYVLVDSLMKVKNDPKYEHYSFPFVDPTNLQVGRLGDNVKEKSIPYHNDCLVFLTEENLDDSLKENLEFRRMNRVVKENLVRQGHVDLDFANSFKREHATIGNSMFESSLKELLDTDLGLIVQPESYKKNQYGISHYRVNVPSGNTNLKRFGKKFRYMGDSFFAKGKFDENLEAAVRNKFLEYHGFSHKLGTRRRAAVDGSFVLEDNGLQFTTYVGSGEMRSLARITNNEVVKFFLLHLTKDDFKNLKRGVPNFEKKYCVDKNVVKFRAVYGRKDASKVGDVYSHTHWLSIKKEHILPKSEYYGAKPISHPVINKKRYW